MYKYIFALKISFWLKIKEPAHTGGSAIIKKYFGNYQYC